MSYGGSSDSSNAGGYGGNSGGYGGEDTVRCGMGSDTSGSGYGGEVSSLITANHSATGSYGGIVGTDNSGATQNSYEYATVAVADTSLSSANNLARNSNSGLGVQGGETCSYDSNFDDLSLEDYCQGLYTLYADDPIIRFYENVSDIVQSTWDSATQWVSNNITQSLQAPLNQPVQGTESSDKLSSFLAENIPGMTKDEVENGLSAMGLTSANETPTLGVIGDQPEGISNFKDGISPTLVNTEQSSANAEKPNNGKLF